MQEKESFIITPPDLRLEKNSISLLILGVDFDKFDNIIEMNNELLCQEDSIVYYGAEEGLTNNTLPWYRAVAELVDVIFINTDNITHEELVLGLNADSNSKGVFWYSESNSKPMVNALLSSYKNRVFDSLSDIETFLEQKIL